MFLKLYAREENTVSYPLDLPVLVKYIKKKNVPFWEQATLQQKNGSQHQVKDKTDLETDLLLG